MPNMTKRFYGEVGYAPTTVDDNGVATASIIKRKYYGDVLDYTSRWQTTDQVNDNIRVSHRISILADPFAIENYPYIRYVEWMCTKWEVISSQVDYPRIVLNLGGVYNGDQT